MDNIDVQEVVSPKGWGYVGEDAGQKLGIYTGKKVRSDIEEALENIEVIIVTESILSLPQDHLKDIVDKSRAIGKEVIIIRKELLYLEKRNHKENEQNKFCVDIESIPINYKMRDPVAPIVLVAGSGERCNKFEIQLELRKIFIDLGYKVTQIGSKNYCEIFGFHSFPEFVYKNDTTITNKILNFNRFINYISLDEKPDVIIIGVPGGIYPYDDVFHNDFGIINYIVSNAISSDFTVLTALNVDNKNEFADSMITSLKYKFNYDLDCFFLSNTTINWIETKSTKNLTYMILPLEKVKQSTLDFDYYNIFDINDREQFKDLVVETLQGYSNANQI